MAQAKRFGLAVAIVVMALLTARPGFSEGVAAVNGVVKDSSGAVVPGVVVTVTSPATGKARKVKTDGAGRYAVTQLAPGEYTVQAKKPGFKTLIATTRLHVAETVSTDLRLEAGAPDIILRVTARAEANTGAAAPVKINQQLYDNIRDLYCDR